MDNIREIYETGFSMLSHAVMKKDHEVLRMLLDLGVDPNTGIHKYALQSAVAYDSTAAVILLDAGAEPNGVYRSTLASAVQRRDIVVVKKLLKLGVDPKDIRHDNAFYAAVCTYRTDIVRLLLDAGASPDGYNKKDPALCAAIRYDSIEIAEMLLDAGANPHIRNHFGDTAYDLAIRHGGRWLDFAQKIRERISLRTLVSHWAEARERHREGKDARKGSENLTTLSGLPRAALFEVLNQTFKT